MFARIFLGPRRNLCGKQIHNQAIFIRRPDGTVTPKETCARTLFTAEANRAIHETRHEPLETYRCFPKPAASFCTTRSIMWLLTSVFPTAACVGHSRRCVS